MKTAGSGRMVANWEVPHFKATSWLAVIRPEPSSCTLELSIIPSQ
jgi:hypothetical protein